MRAVAASGPWCQEASKRGAACTLSRNKAVYQRPAGKRPRCDLQIRSGDVLDYEGRLLQVVKREYTQGSGRQLGNVQVLCLLAISTLPALVHA